MNPMMQIRWIALAERIYRTLLMLYPADYRRAYGALMVQVFRDVSRDRYQQQGMVGMVLWWCTTLLDLSLTVIEQWRKVRFGMAKATFIQLAGSLLVLGGALSGLAAFSQLQPDDHYTYYGIYQVLMWAYAPGSLFIGLGCISLALRYGQERRTLSQWTLYGSGIGSLVMGVGVVATSIQDSLWTIWFVSGVVYTVSLTLFGLIHLRQPTLPVFRALPLQMGAAWLMLLLGILRTETQAVNNALAFLIFLGMGLGWLAIGLAMQRQQRAALAV